MNLLDPNKLRPNLVLPIISGANETKYLDTPGINFYEIVSEFYQDAVFGQLPRTTADAELLKAFESSCIQRSINGYGAVIQSGTNHFVPSTRYVWKWEDEGIPIGYVAGWPFKSDVTKPSADRIRFFIYQEGRELLEVQDYVLEGSALGAHLKTQNTPGVLGVWGNGKSLYPAIDDVLAWYNTRLEKNNQILDKFSNPHLQGPESAKDEEGRLNIDNEHGSYLARSDKEDPEFSYLQLDADQPLNQQTLGNLLDALHLLTGVPATAFGLSSASGDSGVSRERQMFKAISRTRRWRREIETALEAFQVSDVAWVDDPFITWQAHVETELALLTAGVTSPDETRERLNIGGAAPVTPPRQESGE